MIRARLPRLAASLLLALVTACGGSSSKPSTVPLPEDKPAEVAPAKPAEPPAEPPAPPMDPIELVLPATAPTIKLVSGGKGKKAKLAYVQKAGAKQQIKILLDVTSAQTMAGQTDAVNIPTLVLVADAETKSVGADGATEYLATVTSADALDVPNATVKVADFKKDLITTVPGMTIAGTVGANGVAGDMKLRIEKPDKSSMGAMQMVKLSMPMWPVLPKEPVGVGAKWTGAVKAMLQDKVEVTLTTTYELVSRAGSAWVVKGTTKVAGAEQSLGDAKVGKIAGTGSIDAAVTDGVLFPATTAVTEIGFTASQGAESLDVKFTTKGVVQAADAGASTPAVAPATPPAAKK